MLKSESFKYKQLKEACEVLIGAKIQVYKNKLGLEIKYSTPD